MRQTGLGVVVVTYNSGTEAVDCAESVLAAAAAAGLFLRLVVVDNASGDDTVERLRAWASGTRPYEPPADLPFTPARLTKPVSFCEGARDLRPEAVGASPFVLIRNSVNAGFAGGVNVGLAHLALYPEVKHFWVLNPDGVIPPQTLPALVAQLDEAGRYGLMGGRVIFLERPDVIQIDGGTLNLNTGVTGNVNLGRSDSGSPAPNQQDIDFVTGASMVASRAFYEAAGPMQEDYFLYYEEVDWAMRRGDLPLVWCDGLRVYHRGGTAIGSPTHARVASPFSLYFKHRARLRFMRRFGRGLLLAHAYTLAYAARLLLMRRAPEHALATLRGGLGLAPPASIVARLGPEAARRILSSDAT